jgi:hypothetical protein
MKKLHIASEDKLEKSLFKNEIQNSLKNIDIEWVKINSEDSNVGIDSVDFITRNGLICIR